MGKRLRTFVAFRCGKEASAAIRREADRIARVEPAFHASGGDVHLTVQFLGDTPEESVLEISRAVAAAAATSRPVEVRYVGVGAFPDVPRARVVWAGVRDEPAGTLVRLARELGERLRDLGYPPEPRAWTPHVTLGRVRARPSVEFVDAVERRAEVDLAGEILSDLKLILSRPEGGQYHYIDLTTAVLGSRPGS